jgi:hypothetical protein
MAFVAPLLALLVCAQGCGPTAPPRDYYFSPRGSDADGQGTTERPYGSIAKANELGLHAGDRILFEAGQTFDGNLTLDHHDAGTAERPVTIGSYGPGRATIRAGAGTAILVHNAGGVHVRDLVLVGDGRGRNSGSGVEFLNDHSGGKRLEHVRVTAVEASGFGKEGIFVHGAPDDWSPSGYADVAIEDCAAHHNVHTGIYVTGHFDAWRKAYPNENLVVRNCLVHDNAGDPDAVKENRSGSGVFIEGTRTALIESCEARENGSSNRGAHGGPVGIWATLSDRVTIQFCHSHHNHTGGRFDGGGFCLDGGVTHSVLQFNESNDNDGSGYGLFEYDGIPTAEHNALRNNYSRNDGRRNGYAGIHLWNGGPGIEHIEVSHNEVVMPPARGVAAAPPRGIWFQTGCRDVQVTANRFLTAPGVIAIDVAPGQQAVTFKDNVYLTTDGAPVAAGKIAVEWQGRSYISLQAWKSATGQEPPRTAQAASPPNPPAPPREARAE